MLQALAPAKLNLSLHITGKRADGYHLLESIIVFTRLADVLEATPAEALTLEVHGAFAADAGGGDANLVLRAARLLQAASGYRGGAALRLEKNIAVGGGLGGGSADAAATLRVLNVLWALGLTDEQLLALAPQLGADVAMCLFGKPLLARGIGEELTPLERVALPKSVVLVHPRVPLLTAQVYAMLEDIPSARTPMLPMVSLDSLRAQRNDLQRPAIATSPIVAEVLLAMETNAPKPELVRMTGSGACCFALFHDADAAAQFAAGLRQQYPTWWVWQTEIA